MLWDVVNVSVSYTLVQVCALVWIVSSVQSKVPDVHVTCIYSKDCILPCSFTATEEQVLIQWYQQGELIYSFQEDEDDPDESSMTLFPDEVSNGNASLLLKDSRIKSRGRYKCVVNTTETVEEAFVIVKVEAPITRISIESGPTGSVQCSSHGVYPAPAVVWSTEPNAGALQSSTRIVPDSSGLYSVESTLTKLNKSIPLTYTCTISPKYSSQPWRASLRQTEMTGKDGEDLVIPCKAPRNLKNFNLTWIFTKRNKKQDILSYQSQTHKLTNHWKDHVEVELDKVLTGDGSLYLDDLEGSKHSGKYTCTISGPQVEYMSQTSVKISAYQAVAQTGEKSKSSKLWILAVVVAAVAVLGLMFYLYRKYIGKPNKSDQDTEMRIVNTDKTESSAETKPLNSKEDS